jgi:bacterioferritin-associated ferredoxin
MVLCVCNDVLESDFDELLSNGKSVEEAVSILHIGTACGKCLDYLRESYENIEE